MFKRILPIALAVLMILPLAACGGPSENTEIEDPTEVVTEVATEVAVEDVTEAVVEDAVVTEVVVEDVTEAVVEDVTGVVSEDPTEVVTEAPTTVAKESKSAGELTLPFNETPPDIAGTFNAADWDGALVSVITPEIIKNGPGFTFKQAFENPVSMTQYMFWNNDGLYLAYDVKDPTKGQSAPAGKYLNDTDTVQLLLDPKNRKLNTPDSTDGGLYIFDWCSASEVDRSGAPAWYEHWQHNTGTADLGIVLTGKDVDGGYEMMVFVPWTVFNKKRENLEITAGMQFGMGNIFIDFDGDTMVDLYGNYGSSVEHLGNGAYLYTVTLG